MRLAEGYSVRASRELGNQMGQKLVDLLNGYPMQNLLGTMDREIFSIAYDSRRVEPGALFVAIPGLREDGARFIREAMSRGATAVITQSSPEELLELGLGVPDITQMHVEDARQALAWVSAQFYSHPSTSLNLVGITGTNGKTSLTYMLESICSGTGKSCGVIGSINYRYGGKTHPAPVTTPESLDLNRMMRAMGDSGVTDCFLEVSSHAIAMQRVRELGFSVAAFTNLSRDHLDFHETPEHYRNTKKRLFLEYSVAQQVLNLDDPVGRELLAETHRPTLTTGIESMADVRAESIQLSESGARFLLRTPFGNREVESALLGRPNIENMLTAAAIALIQGVSLDSVIGGLQALRGVPGRFERVQAGQGFTVVVDYAHTDDALSKALAAVRGFCRGRLLTVFGCGGDRDRSKRAPMGRIAYEHSDLLFITSDNPRSENPTDIMAEVSSGLPQDASGKSNVWLIEDRRAAIHQAIEMAEENDVVLIAGKGHEDYQILGGETIHFDDREVALEALRKRLRQDG